LINAPLSESIDELRVLFKEISIIACKTKGLCDSMWDQYLEKLPSVLEKLNQDANFFWKMILPLV
jgi:serine O-acetyltransferase